MALRELQEGDPVNSPDFKYTKYEKGSTYHFEALNDLGQWIKCIGGESHAQQVARTFSTAYRRVETDTRAYVYEVRD